MIPVQIRFTRKIIEHVDRLVESGVYSNRSEAIRDATRRLVVGTALGNIMDSPDMNPGTKNLRASLPTMRERDVK